MVVFERKALTEPSGKDSSNGNSLESSKLGESHEDRKQYKRSLVSAPPWAKRKPNKMFPGPKRNPGNARGTDRNRRVSVPLSPIFSLFLAPAGKLYLKVQALLAHDEAPDASPPPMGGKRRPVYVFPSS